MTETNQPWHGCWQLLTEGGEDVLTHENSTVAVRPQSGFIIYAGNHFIEIRTDRKRKLPAAWVANEQEMIEYFDSVYTVTGACSWERSNGYWHGKHDVLLAMDPRLEGSSFERRFIFDSESCESENLRASDYRCKEKWRRLSGKGESALSGAWESKSEYGHWIYLTTQGHYGVFRAAGDRKAGTDGKEYTDEEKISLFPQAGANIGARVETSETFDHWPFISQIPGYEIRKHETFRITCIEEDRFEASIPPNIPPGEWKRLP